ncbi:MAG: hypothetical protein DI537_35315 [Stutzerimonas stutzeri]|nr:MAG: hypothetical protein DI537_35315 [Stutzerimonas stutzeri]
MHDSISKASGNGNMFGAKLAFQLPERFGSAPVLWSRENLEGLPIGLGAIQRHRTKSRKGTQQPGRALAIERFENTLRLQQNERPSDPGEPIEMPEIAHDIGSVNSKPVKEVIVIEVDLGRDGKERLAAQAARVKRA